MSLGHGTKITTRNIVFAIDAADPKSNFLVRSSSNILNDPYNWSTGNDSASGYGRNGNVSEQSRAFRPNPFGGNSVTWRSIPSGDGNADGGWNSSYYAIDRQSTYRYSVYVKRYAEGGGTFYMGTNPAPLRNDNDGLQGNPYFTHPPISSLTLDQWYLVVAHCFPENYAGGRHPDSGWYEIDSATGAVNKIPDKSYGNCGTEDVRWPSSTTNSMHRTYHFYTSNVNAGVEWAFPRLDKCDGTEPTIKELCSKSPGRVYNALNGIKGLIASDAGRPQFTELGGVPAWSFDATNEYFDSDGVMLSGPAAECTLEAWIYPAAAEVISGDRGCVIRLHGGGSSTYMSWNKSTRKMSAYRYDTSNQGYQEPGPALNREEWHHVIFVWDGTTHKQYINGQEYTISTSNAGVTPCSNVEIGMENTARQFAGGISAVRIYNTALTAAEALQNFNNTKGRYGK